MEDFIDKLEQIYKQIEEDRNTALEEFRQIQQDALFAEPKSKHKVREVGGQLLRIALDASLGMAKIIEPIVKNQGASGLSMGKKELLQAIEQLDKDKDTSEPVIETPIDKIDVLTGKPIIEEDVENMSKEDLVIDVGEEVAAPQI